MRALPLGLRVRGAQALRRRSNGLHSTASSLGQLIPSSQNESDRGARASPASSKDDVRRHASLAAFRPTSVVSAHMSDEKGKGKEVSQNQGVKLDIPIAFRDQDEKTVLDVLLSEQFHSLLY